MVKKKLPEMTQTNAPIYTQKQTEPLRAPKLPEKTIETKTVRNQNLKHQAYEIANRARNKQYQERWYKGDTPTTAEYYSAVRRVKELDSDKAQQSWDAFYQMQNDPNSQYYEPYLYKMTNTAAANGIYDLLGVDISGGITQSQINELKQYADYSNRGVSGTPNESKNPAQQLAYWLYNLEKDEKTTQQAELEMEWMHEDVQNLVDKGFSDEYIVKHMDMTRYPTIKKMQESASFGAVTPLNRPIGYSSDYVYGAIWAARNGGSSGNSMSDIANWHDKVGNVYKPDKDAEAARDPESDNYHPYSLGATTELDPRKEYTKKQLETAKTDTENALKELEGLNKFVENSLAAGKTAGEIKSTLSKEHFADFETNYPTLAKMEFARQEGTYLLLTDAVDFALPYYERWIDDKYAERQRTINTMLGNSKQFMDKNFGTDFESNDGKNYFDRAQETAKEIADNAIQKAQEQEEKKPADAPKASEKYEETASAPEQAETPAEEEKPAETPVESKNKEEPVQDTEEVVPNPYFDIRQIETDEQAKTELWSALSDYRRGMPVTDENAAAFIQKYPYLFGGVGSYIMNKGGEPKLVEVDTRVYSFDNQVQKKNEFGKTGAELLKAADEAQRNGYYSQYEYVNLLMTLATEVENAKANGVTFEEYINTEGTGANALLKDTTQRLTAYKVAQDAIRKQEILDYGSEIHNLRSAYESGNFDNSYAIVRSEEERAIAQADPANEGKYIWTEDEKNKWQQLIEESYNTVVTSDEIGIYDPKKYYTLADGDVYRIVEEELGYIDEYVNIDDYEMYGVKNDVYHLISNRVKNTLLNDLGIAKAAGITVDEYYNSLGYGSSYDRKNWDRNYDDLTDYVTGLVQKEIEAWRNLEIGLTEDLESAIEEMEWHEYYEDDTDTLNFTEEEIQAVLENGDITEEQANMIRLYNDVKDPEGKKRSLEYWQENGGIDTIKTLLYSNLVKLSSDQIRAKQDANESRPESYLGVVGNRTDGKASLGYVLGTGVKLGATEHKKSWLETWYGFQRADSSELEKEYRARFSREEVRNNILSTIETISDAELRDALITELDLYDGDIYDFNYDFTIEHIREKIRKTDEKIAYVQEEVAQYCTPEQARMLNTISSGTNTVLFMAENIALTSLAAATGVPIVGAHVMGSALTTGVTSAAETMNTLMDADVSRESALLAGAVDGMVQVAVEVSLDRFVGIDGKFSPAKSGKNFRAYMAKGIEGEASEGFLRAAMRYGMQLPDLVGSYALDKAKRTIRETAEELIQYVTSNVITNKALELSGKGEYKDQMTWDEVFKVLEESAIQSLILDVGSDIITAPVKSAKYALNKRQTQLESARKLAQKEMVNGAQLKRVKEQLEKSVTDGTLEAKMNEAANISAVEERTSEKIIEKTEELKSSPAQGKLQTARGKLEQAQADYDDAVNRDKAAKAALKQASAPFETPGTTPTQDEVDAYIQAKVAVAQTTPEKQLKLDDLEKAQKEFDEANTEAETEIREIVSQAADEARKEKAQEIREEQVRQAEEEYRQAEERAKRNREQVEREIQETTGATDAEMEKVREKAQKMLDERSRNESQTKDELVKAFREKFGKSYNIRLEYDDNAQAGWVTKPGQKKGEIVFNANLDASTLYTTVAAHELSHVAEDSKFAKDVQNSVFELYYGEDTERIKSDIEMLKADYAEDGIQLTDAEARLELTAELLQDVFGNNKAWIDSILAKRPNLLVKVYNWLNEKVTYLKKLVTEGKDVANAYRTLNAVKNNFAKALNDAAVKNGKKAAYEITDVEGQAQETETSEIPSDGSVREYALKRRVEAAEKAKAAAKLMNAADVYKKASDWKNYSRAIELLYNMGNTSVRPNKPHIIMKTLAEAFGIGVYEGKAPLGSTFEKYDKRVSALKLDRNSELDVAFAMYAVGEKIKKMTGINDPSSYYSMGDFLFEYMMNTDKQLSKVARNYLNDVFRPELEKAGDGFMNALETARANLTTFKNANTAEKLSAYIVSKSDKKPESIGNKIRELKINIIDSTYAAEIVDMVTGTHDFRKAAAYLPYAERRADAVLTGDAFVDLDGNITGGDTLKTALRDIKKKEVDDFNSYLIAREAVSRFDAGMPPFEEAFTLEDMRETVEMFESKYKHFKAAGERYDAWWDNFMQTYVVAEGFLTPEGYTKMSEVHPHYVSFARAGTKKYRITYAKGHSDLEIIAPLESAISMVNQFTKRAALNRFARTFDRLYQQNEDLGFIATELKQYLPEETAYNADLDTYSAKTDDTYENAEIDENMKALSESVVYADDAKYGDVITVIRKDGTAAKYVLNDKATFDLLSGYSYEIQNKALKTIGAITRFMTRATTGINPLFLVTNSVRDFQKSVNYGSWAYTYGDGLARWLKTFFPTLLGKGKDLEQYKALGGGGWSVIRLTSNKGMNSYKNALFRDDRKFRELSVPQMIGRVLQTPRRLVERAGDAVETTSRLVEYKYGKHDKTTQQGRIDAFMAAQEVTVDFERGGKRAQLLRTFIPFANATMQGYVQNVRMYTDAEKNRLAPRIAKSLFNSTLLGAASAIMCKSYLGEDDEKYSELMQDIKHGYILFPLFGDGEREFLRLPVAQDWLTKAFFEFGRQLGSGEFTDGTLGGDIASLALDMIAEPILGSTTIISPILDVGKNLSWSDTPIVKQSIQKYAPEARYDATTAEVFKWASRQLVGVFRDGLGVDGNSPFLNYFTPEALEYLAQQYTGVYGQLLIPAFSHNKYAGETNVWQNVGKSIRNRFTTDADSYNQVTEAYYDNSDFVTEVIDHARGMREYKVNASLSDSELAEIYGEIKNANSDGGILKKYEDQIQAHRNKIAEYESDYTLDDAMKADLVESETERINQIMRDYNAWVGERKEILKGNLFNREHRLLAENADVAVLSDTFRTAYENKEPYMMEIASLKSGGTNKSVMPKSDYTFQNKNKNWEVKAEHKAEFDKAFENAYANLIAGWSKEDPAYKSKSDEDKAAYFSDLRSEAQKKAKELAIAYGWIEQKE